MNQYFQTYKNFCTLNTRRVDRHLIWILYFKREQSTINDIGRKLRLRQYMSCVYLYRTMYERENYFYHIFSRQKIMIYRMRKII